ISTEKIAQALYTNNSHEKAAPKPQHLYMIKKEEIEKLLKEKKAKKIGLNFYKNHKYSHQHSTLLIKVADYYFHFQSAKEDFQTLKHLCHLDENFRNPQTRMSLSYAKKIVYSILIGR